MNRKRVERLWRLEGHRVPPAKAKNSGQKALGGSENSSVNLPAIRPDHVWSYDFISIRTVEGGPMRVLNIVDEFTRECVASYVARSIGARAVKRVLEKLFAKRKPQFIRSDNGREFIAGELVAWLKDQGVIAAFVAKGSPQQNPFVERFNGTMRRELLNGELLHSVTEARVVIGEWVDIYNNVRPHRGLGMKTPAAFAKDHRLLSKQCAADEGGA